MFDVGFLELVVLLTVGLLVLGPERLPRVARQIGRYLAYARRSWTNLQQQVDAELNAAERRGPPSMEDEDRQ